MRPHPNKAVLAVVALTLPLLLASGGAASGVVAPPAPQEPKQDWEGKTLSRIRFEGLIRENETTLRNLISLKRGKPLTRADIDQTYKDLWKDLWFGDVSIDDPVPDPEAPGQFMITIRVQESPLVEKVTFEGNTSISAATLKLELRIAPGSRLNAFHLKQDRDRIRELYLQKGHHFSQVEDQSSPGATGVILKWKVTEGPLVGVEKIVFTGAMTLEESQLKKAMVSKENGTIFWIIPSGREPFIERNLREDVERIKFAYRLQGWLDIQAANRVFLKDLIFSDDKTNVTIVIHVDEGPRYKIRNIRFEFDPASKRIFTPEEMLRWIDMKPGDPYSEIDANKGAAALADRYGERAYILADIAPVPVFSRDTNELDLVYTIRENEKILVGRILFEGRDRKPGEGRGNVRSDEEILRREFTRAGFVPGEEYNRSSLRKAMNRIYDRGWTEPMEMDGIRVHNQETDEPGVRDVTVDVKEAQTGSLRFAAGFSSSYGVLGIFEFTQKNFDISDVPSSAEDFLNGDSFVGGGQTLRLRAAPAARRQSFMIDFREPYLLGYDLGLALRGSLTSTTRESWDERQKGESIVLDKRFDPFIVQLALSTFDTRIDDIDSGAPSSIRNLAGSNEVMSITPAIAVDLRDSQLLPTEGWRTLVSYEYAGQFLGGDFDFFKVIVDGDAHIPVWSPGERDEPFRRWVLSFQATFKWAHESRRLDEIPIFERFFAGGRDSIRGFEFRGLGPHENNDPIGGDAYAYGGMEFSVPLVGTAIRGAVFYDIGNLAPTIEHLWHEKWRNSVGFGIRFMIPQLGLPVSLDFGFPLTKKDEDERETITFDIGRLF